MKCILFIALCLTIVSSTLAQIPSRVADIDPSGNSSPRRLFSYNNKLLFVGDSAANTHLFSYDTINGVSTIIPKNNLNLRSWSDLDVFNGKLYVTCEFRPPIGGAINRFYFYDGISPVAPAPGVNLDTFVDLNWIKAAGSKLYFNATKTTPRSELWCYTGSGRASLINVAPSNGFGSQPYNLFEHGGKLYFHANTSNSTRKIHVLNPSNNSFSVLSSSLYPSGFTGVPLYLSTPGKLYFISSGDTVGRELFVYDGSSIRRLSNFQSTGGSADGPMCTYGGYIYFSGAPDAKNFQLYRYSLSTGNVSLAATIDAAGNSQIYGMIVYRNKLYFGARSSTTGRELWSFDGELHLVADLCPGAADGLGPLWGAKNKEDGVFTEYNGSLYFAGNNCTGSGVELYRFTGSNGGSTGISHVSWNGSVQVYPNPVSSSANLAITLKSDQFLSASLTDMQGRQVWTSPARAYASGRQVLTVPMQNFASGQYFFRVVDERGRLLASAGVVK